MDVRVFVCQESDFCFLLLPLLAAARYLTPVTKIDAPFSVKDMREYLECWAVEHVEACVVIACRIHFGDVIDEFASSGIASDGSGLKSVDVCPNLLTAAKRLGAGM